MGTQNSVPRTRRTYTSQFKAELIAACLKPGTSIAATAREQGMNANALHRWLKEHRLGQHQITCTRTRLLQAISLCVAIHRLPSANGMTICAAFFLRPGARLR